MKKLVDRLRSRIDLIYAGIFCLMIGLPIVLFVLLGAGLEIPVGIGLALMALANLLILLL